MKKNFKRIIAIIVTLAFALGTFLPSALAALKTNIGVFQYYSDPANETTSQYLIYVNDFFGNNDCKVFLSDSDQIEPTEVEYFDCDEDDEGNNVVIVDFADSTSINNTYLWVKGNPSKVYEIEYDKALTSMDSEEADLIGTKIIAVPEEKEDTDTQGEFYNYLKVSMVAGKKYAYILSEAITTEELALVKSALATEGIQNFSPAVGIVNVSDFLENYNNFLPTFDDARWVDLEEDSNDAGFGYIKTPETQTKNNEYTFIVWLMEYEDQPDNDSVIDLQIMNCVKKVEKTIKKTTIETKKLPNTGVSYALNALFAGNAVLLGVASWRRWKLVKLINEK